MAKDYYQILGVSKGASAEEIKKAYRQLAHQYHPDKAGGNEAKFKEINAAYQVLSNPEKRRQYDQFGTTFDQAGAGGGPSGANWEDFVRQAGFSGFGNGASSGGVEFDVGDIFSEFFGGGRTSRRSRRREQRGQDIAMDIEIDFKEAAFGIKKDLALFKSIKCASCNGNGAEPGTPIKECTTCKGTGVVERVQKSFFGAIRSQTTCPDCGGEGKKAETKCKKCAGTGVEKKKARLTVNIPAGIDDGQAIRIANQGEAGLMGAPAGDLFITVHVRSAEGFYREGDNVISRATISYPLAVLGGKIVVETIDGEVTLKIPAGTEAGQALRLRGKGIPRLQGGGHGDHIVQIVIDVLQHPSREEKRLLKELERMQRD